MCCCSANHRLLLIYLPFIIFLQHRGIETCCGDNVCTVCHAYPAAFLFFCVMCLYFTLFQLLLSVFIIPLAVAYNSSPGGLSRLIGVFMCSHEHWCVIPAPTAGCFSICLPFIMYLAA